MSQKHLNYVSKVYVNVHGLQTEPLVTFSEVAKLETSTLFTWNPLKLLTSIIFQS